MPTLLRRYALLILAVSLVAAGPAAWAQGQTAGRFVSVTVDVVWDIAQEGINRRA